MAPVNQRLPGAVEAVTVAITRQHAAEYQDRMNCASTALSLVQFPLLLFLAVPIAQLVGASALWSHNRGKV